MIAAWSEEMDADLLRQRRDSKLPWRVVHIEGATVRECQKRFEYLTSGATKPVVRIATKGPDPDEDGLDRLIRKGKLRGDRLAMAKHYRAIDRLAEQEGGSIRSCLDDTVRGGQGGLPGEGQALTLVSAKRELFVMRHQVLRGQIDVLTAMDGVLISGHTLLALAGGSSSKSAELMMALNIGLDLLADHVRPKLRSAA